MPDTTQPYAYIEIEIERLKYEARNARDSARILLNTADTHDLDSRELKLALQKQIEADNRASI